jgi:hypothetical protein
MYKICRKLRRFGKFRLQNLFWKFLVIFAFRDIHNNFWIFQKFQNLSKNQKNAGKGPKRTQNYFSKNLINSNFFWALHTIPIRTVLSCTRSLPDCICLTNFQPHSVWASLGSAECVCATPNLCLTWIVPHIVFDASALHPVYALHGTCLTRSLLESFCDSRSVEPGPCLCLTQTALHIAFATQGFPL